MKHFRRVYIYRCTAISVYVWVLRAIRNNIGCQWSTMLRNIWSIMLKWFLVCVWMWMCVCALVQMFDNFSIYQTFVACKLKLKLMLCHLIGDDCFSKFGKRKLNKSRHFFQPETDRNVNAFNFVIYSCGCNKSVCVRVSAPTRSNRLCTYIIFFL